MDFREKVHDPTPGDLAVVELDRTLASFLHDAEDRRKWRVYILEHALVDVGDPDPKPVERMLPLFQALRQLGYLVEPPNSDAEGCHHTKRPTAESSFRLTNRRPMKDDARRLGAFNTPVASGHGGECISACLRA